MESKIKELQCVLEHQQDLILNLLQEEEENQLIIQSYEDKIKQLMNENAMLERENAQLRGKLI